MSTPVLRLWRKLEARPFGKRVFSWIICHKAPYFASIAPRMASLEPGRGEHTNGLGNSQCETTEMPSCRHRPDEHGRVERVITHPHPITENRSSAEWRRRVDGQHRRLDAN